MTSHGLWGLTAAPAPDTESLSAEIAADVAVVGGGFTGLSAALRLAAAGAKTAVLERDEIGFGGSGRNVGLVNAGMWVMPDDLPERLGADYGIRLLDLLGTAPDSVFNLIEKHKIDCEPVRTGTLHCAVNERGVRELAARTAQWAARGADVRLLDADETAAKVGTRAYKASLLDRRAGTIQPLGYARGLATAAIGAGAQVFTHSGVTGVTRDGTRWCLRTTDGAVRANHIIVATNAYTTAPWPQVRAELVHLPYFNLATAPLSQTLRSRILPERQGAWDTNKILTSLRWDRQGRLIFGSVGALRGTGRAVHHAWARRALRRLFSDIGDLSFETGWYGMIGMTADHLPKLHRFAPNVIGFSGYNGRGIGPGTVFGEVLAQFITGEIREQDLPLPVTEPRQEGFRGLREGTYEIGAQAVHLARTLI